MTTLIFPKNIEGGRSAQLLDVTDLLTLYNEAHLDQPVAKTAIDGAVTNWALTTADANGWKAVEHIGNQIILKALSAQPAKKSTSASAAASAGTKASTRAATGSLQATEWYNPTPTGDTRYHSRKESLAEFDHRTRIHRG